MSQTEEKGTRRDFLFYATGGTAAVGAGAAVWPLINQMNPSADVKALASIRVDVSEVEPGTQLTVKWLGKPVFIRRRTETEIEEAQSVNLDELLDNTARNDNIAEATSFKKVLRARVRQGGTIDAVLHSSERRRSRSRQRHLFD